MIVLKDVSAYAKIVLIAEIVYVLGAALVKWAILLLYRRLFGSNRRFQYVLWSVGAFVSAYSLAEVLVIIFQCRPVDAAWNLSVTPSYCVNMSLGAIIVGALNAATDFLVLLLPIPVVLGLNLKTKWKLQLIGIFLLGGFVCLGSIYRVTILHKLSYFDATCTYSASDPEIPRNALTSYTRERRRPCHLGHGGKLCWHHQRLPSNVTTHLQPHRTRSPLQRSGGLLCPVLSQVSQSKFLRSEFWEHARLAEAGSLLLCCTIIRPPTQLYADKRSRGFTEATEFCDDHQRDRCFLKRRRELKATKIRTINYTVKCNDKWDEEYHISKRFSASGSVAEVRL